MNYEYKTPAPTYQSGVGYTSKDVAELLSRYEEDAQDRVATVSVTCLMIGGLVGFLIGLILYRGGC